MKFYYKQSKVSLKSFFRAFIENISKQILRKRSLAGKTLKI